MCYVFYFLQLLPLLCIRLLFRRNNKQTHIIRIYYSIKFIHQHTAILYTIILYTAFQYAAIWYTILLGDRYSHVIFYRFYRGEDIRLKSYLYTFHFVIISNHITDSHITDNHITNNHITDNHITDNHITDNHIIDDHIIDNHITPSPDR